MGGETLGLLHGRGEQGTGSLQSWHVNEYEVAGDPSMIQVLPNICEGPLPLFPRLDVMKGSSTAYNDGMYMKEWGNYILKGHSLNNADLDFEITHGKLQGYKTGTGGDNAFADILRWPFEFALQNKLTQAPVANDAIDHAIAEAKHGWHAVDEQTLALQKQLNFNHNRGYMGIDESGRRKGLEQFWNKAVLPWNPLTNPLDCDTAIPMESPNEIMINGEGVNPEDTAAQGVVG